MTPVVFSECPLEEKNCADQPLTPARLPFACFCPLPSPRAAEYRTRHLVSAQALPSVCAYTLSNSAGRACCSALSPDCSAAVAGYSDSSVLFWDMREAAQAHKEAVERMERAAEAKAALGLDDMIMVGPTQVAKIEREAEVAKEAEKQARPGPPQVRRGGRGVWSRCPQRRMPARPLGDLRDNHANSADTFYIVRCAPSAPAGAAHGPRCARVRCCFHAGQRLHHQRWAPQTLPFCLCSVCPRSFMLSETKGWTSHSHTTGLL